MENNKPKLIYWIISGFVSFIIANFGLMVLKEFPDKPYIGVLTIILAFILLYFSFYAFQIKSNQDNIKELEIEINKIKMDEEIKEKLLNTIRDIVVTEDILKKRQKKR